MRVCFSSPMARPVFEPAVPGSFGGSEVRAHLFATGLAKRGIHTDVVVDAHDPPPAHELQGVGLRYRTLPRPLPRLRDEPRIARRLALGPALGIRRLLRSVRKHRSRSRAEAPRLDPLLAQIPADVYCCFGVHHHAASVIYTAARLERPSVLFLASDTDLSEHYRVQSDHRNAYQQRGDICHFALSRATCVVAQSTAQQQLLRHRFGRDAALIRNPVDLRERSPSDSPEAASDVLWIGRADCFSKRADLAIKLAKSCPELRFTLIMNPRDRRVYQQLVASVTDNVRVIPQVPWHRIDDYFGAATLLLNTSNAEGFPNTFLQAACHGVPIVSLNVDPDSMLSRYGCGVVAEGDLPRTAQLLTTLCTDPRARARMAQAGRRYVEAFHDAEGRCDELVSVLQAVCADRGTRVTSETAA